MSIKNNVTLIGRLVKDPELRYTANGVAVANITLAVQRDYKNQNNEIECDFPNAVVWKKPAENLANYCKKGDMIGILGRLQTRSYDDSNGKKVFVTEVISQSVDFLRIKAWENGQQGGRMQPQNGGNNYLNNNQGFTRVDDDPFGGNGSIDISDDELPF